MAGNSLKPIRQYVPCRSTPGKLSGIDVEEILDRIAAGDYPANIARHLDVSRPALHYKLKDHPEYHLCREIGMEIRLDDGLEKVHAATDLNSARMEEVKLRRLEWRAEREFSRRWGPKQEVTTNIIPQFTINIGSNFTPELPIIEAVITAVPGDPKP